MTVEGRAGVEAHLGLVHKIAAEVHRTVGGSVSLDDLVAYGSRGLLEAHQRFDASRGFAFSTFAHYRIRGAMFDGVREMGWRPRTAGVRREARFAEGANLVLQQAAEDAPSWGGDEASGIEQAITQVAAVFLVSLDAEGGPELPDQGPDAEVQVDEGRRRDLVRSSVTSLPEKERRILELVYFEDLSIKEAGETLGLSKSWSCRLHARALKLLGEAVGVQEGPETQPQEVRSR